MIHEDSIVIDGHSDIGVDVVRKRRWNQKKVIERIHAPKYKAGGMDGGPITIMSDSPRGVGEHPVVAALKSINLTKEDFEESKDIITYVKTVDEFKKAVRDEKLAFFFHFEGMMAVLDRLSYLRFYYDLGVRSMGLTWNSRNLIADSSLERSNSRLSNFGVEVIHEMNRLGIVIDVSHLNDLGFWDVIEISKDPIMASHSNCRTLCNHPRNLTDEQIKALAQNGGVIGVVFYSRFIDKEDPSLEKLLDHVDHISNLVGVDAIGIGADFMDYNMEYTGRPGPLQVLEIKNVTKMQNFTRGLVSRGYSDQEIEKILGGNFLRLYKKVFGS